MQETDAIIVSEAEGKEDTQERQLQVQMLADTHDEEDTSGHCADKGRQWSSGEE